MKKWFCALGMMLALLMSVALADGVKVTFAEKNGQINGGYDYTLKLNVSPARDKDLTASLTCDGLDGAYSAVIPACLLYTFQSRRDLSKPRIPSSA